ncbi:hypothetical protein FACS1894178_6740 [Bacteroidia bacterium]|nr:hypothetical protein FACS1894178_6740 [Bacteroidia bacterium]
MNEKDFKVWRVAKSIISNTYGERRVWAENSIKTIRIELQNKNFPTATMLLDLLEKEVNEYNSLLAAKISKLNNIEYKEGKGWKSSFFEKFPMKWKNEILKKVDENPNIDYYTIYRENFKNYTL